MKIHTEQVVIEAPPAGPLILSIKLSLDSEVEARAYVAELRAGNARWMTIPVGGRVYVAEMVDLPELALVSHDGRVSMFVRARVASVGTPVAKE